MDRTHSKAARLRRIEHKLYNSPIGVRVLELADYCGVDRRTIYRDLESLEEMGVPVWQDGKRYGIDRESYLSTVRLNLNEAIALYFAARLLSHHSDENNPHVAGALDKLAASFPDAMISGHIARAADQIRERPLRVAYVRVLEAVTRAWADRRKVQIRYRAPGGAVTERVICPYFLEVARGEPGSYVIGYDDLRQALRTFKIERITDAEVLSETYTIPPDFDPYEKFSASWSVMDDAEVDIHLRFTAVAAERVRESIWHHSQRLVEGDDGGCELFMRVNGIREVRGWVLSWGSDVEVMTPAELRDEVKTHAEHMLKRYEKL